MKKTSKIVAFFLAFLILFSCKNNSTKNSNQNLNSSNNTIEEKKIGAQIWAVNTLDVSTFRNGDIINEAKTDEEWRAAGERGEPAWSNYPKDSPYAGSGDYKMYNWFAITDSRGLTPQGWHVPSDEEWTILLQNFESNFTYNVVGGYRDEDGRFQDHGSYGRWWSTSTVENNEMFAWARFKGLYDPVISRDMHSKKCGLFVRYLKD